MEGQHESPSDPRPPIPTPGPALPAGRHGRLPQNQISYQLSVSVIRGSSWGRCSHLPDSWRWRGRSTGRYAIAAKNPTKRRGENVHPPQP